MYIFFKVHLIRWLTGFEPAWSEATIQCINHFCHNHSDSKENRTLIFGETIQCNINHYTIEPKYRLHPSKISRDLPTNFYFSLSKLSDKDFEKFLNSSSVTDLKSTLSFAPFISIDNVKMLLLTENSMLPFSVLIKLFSIE